MKKLFFSLLLGVLFSGHALATFVQWSDVKTCDEGLVIRSVQSWAPGGKHQRTFELELFGLAQNILSRQLGYPIETRTALTTPSWGIFYGEELDSYYRLYIKEEDANHLTLHVFHTPTGRQIGHFQFNRCF